MMSTPKVPNVEASHSLSAPNADSTYTESVGSVPESEDNGNPFLNPKIAAYYREVYEQAKYECRHVFDPALRWTQAEEKKVVRKVDWHVCTWACIMFFSLNVDRKNISQAVSANMLEQLHLTTDDYNYSNTIFLVGWILAEIPSQLISKKLGADRWIPTQMVLWALVATAQAAVANRASFFACRALLGILEGGFIPELVLWLSYFYTSKELPIRLSFFSVALSVTSIVTSLLAFALLHLDGVHGIAGWRWIFLVEGLITLGIGLASFFLMPASATQTKTWFRPSGWFTEREEAIVVNRILRDDPSKGDMHNREAISPNRMWRALTDYDMWPLYAIGIILNIPESPPSTYLTLTLRNLGFNAFNTNLLTIPSTAIGIFTLLSLTWFSERVNERSFVTMIQSIWLLPCLLALRFWSGALRNAWGTYAVVTVLLAYPYSFAIMVAWVSRNSGSVRTRTVSAAVYNMFDRLGNIISSNIYRENDKPLYHEGNTVLIAIDIMSMVLLVLAKVYYVWQNKRRDRLWKSMNGAQREEYLEISKDQGNKRLDFRFAH